MTRSEFIDVIANGNGKDIWKAAFAFANGPDAPPAKDNVFWWILLGALVAKLRDYAEKYGERESEA